MTEPDLGQLLASVKTQDKCAILDALFTSFQAVPGTASWDLLYLALGTKDATIDGERERLAEHLADLGHVNARLPAASTIQAAIKAYPVDKRPRGASHISYNRASLERDFDEALRTNFLGAVGLAELGTRDFFVAMDGTSRPFFGAAPRYGKGTPQRPLHEMSEAGRDAVPAFTGRPGKPQYRGTVNKLAHFHLSAFLYDTKESLPLSIRSGPVTPEAIADFIEQLRRLPIQPAFLFADKEFCNKPKLDPVREYCDAHRIAMLIAHPSDPAIRKLAFRDWNENKTRTVPGEEIAFWSMNRHNWRNNKGHEFNVLTLFFTRDPRKDLDAGGHEILRLPNGVYAVSFYTNVDLNVTADEVWLLYKQYSLRWSQECLLKRWKAYCGRSQSPGLFMRDFIHFGSMLMLGGYALWRIERSRRLGLRPGHRLLSHTRFFGAVARHFEDRLLASALKGPPRSPPMPRPPAPPTLV